MRLNLIKTKEGGLLWNVPLDDALALLAAGNYHVTLRRIGKGQSDRQRGLLRLWFAAIADVTDCTPSEVHDWYCRQFLSYPTEFCGGGMVCKTTSGLKRAELSRFMDQVREHARDFLGITLPDPHDIATIDILYNHE